MKERNTNYRLSSLRPGDIFYMAGDRKKTLLHLSPENPFETVIQKGFTKQYANCICKATGKPERHLVDRWATYLCNINETA